MKYFPRGWKNQKLSRGEIFRHSRNMGEVDEIKEMFPFSNYSPNEFWVVKATPEKMVMNDLCSFRVEEQPFGCSQCDFQVFNIKCFDWRSMKEPTLGMNPSAALSVTWSFWEQSSSYTFWISYSYGHWKVQITIHQKVHWILHKTRRNKLAMPEFMTVK